MLSYKYTILIFYYSEYNCWYNKTAAVFSSHLLDLVTRSRDLKTKFFPDKKFVRTFNKVICSIPLIYYYHFFNIKLRLAGVDKYLWYWFIIIYWLETKRTNQWYTWVFFNRMSRSLLFIKSKILFLNCRPRRIFFQNVLNRLVKLNWLHN